MGNSIEMLLSQWCQRAQAIGTVYTTGGEGSTSYRGFPFQKMLIFEFRNSKRQ